MLYEDITEGAVVQGRVLEASTYAELETIQAEAKAMGATLFVAGDTSPTGDEEGLKHHNKAIVGVLVAKAEAGQVGVVSHDAVQNAAARYAQLDWSKLGGHALGTVYVYDEATDEESEVKEGTFLLCWGPLPQVVLSIGCIVEKESKPVYDLHRSQDMDQVGGRVAVDGKRIDWSEFGGCKHVDLSDEAIARYRARVPLHQDPKLYLTVRYD